MRLIYRKRIKAHVKSALNRDEVGAPDHNSCGHRATRTQSLCRNGRNATAMRVQGADLGKTRSDSKS